MASGTGCDERGGGLECGPGTTAQASACVPDDVACGPDGCASDCGPGTRRDEATGDCVAGTVVCGTGTRLVDGECVLEGAPVSCAPGTVLNEGRCVLAGGACAPGTTLDATGVCVPDGDIACGAGTALVDGLCVPDSATLCADGASWDPVAGGCVSDIACRDDQVAHDGHCISQDELDATMADVLEPIPEHNDPAYRGSPQALVLPGLGDSVLFSGTIDAPSDVDGNTTLDQDVDAWSFTAAAGDMVEVVVHSLGASPVGFRVVGPHGYVRHSPLYVTRSPARYLWLPHDGEYRIEVAPQPFIDGVETAPSGDALTRYVGALERVAAPVAQDLALDGSTTGQLLDLRDNLYQLRAPAETLLALSLDGLDEAFEPVLVVLDAAGHFVTQASPDARELHHWLRALDDAQILVDYVRANSTQDAFTLNASQVGVTDLGALAADASLSLPAVPVVAGEPLVYSVTLEAGQGLGVRMVGVSDIDFVVYAPDGAVHRRDGRRGAVYAQSAGRYVIEVTALSSGSLTLELTSSTPIDLGAVDTTTANMVHTDLPAMPRLTGMFLRVELTGPMWLELVVSGNLPHDYKLTPLATDASRLRAAYYDYSSFDDNALDLFALAPQVLVVEVWTDTDNYDPKPLDILAQPLPRLEAEPNDTYALADTLELDGEVVHGWFDSNDDLEQYQITLPEPLGSGELLEVSVLDERRNVYACSLRDATGQQVIDAWSDSRYGCRLRAAQLPAGDYHVVVASSQQAAVVPLPPSHYQIQARRVPGVLESEPNDVVAQPVSLDTMTFGDIAQKGDIDRFVYTLPMAQTSGAGLAVSLAQANQEREQGDMSIVEPGGREVFAQRIRQNERVLLVGLGAGDLALDVMGHPAARGEHIARYSLLLEPIAFTEYADPGTNTERATALPITLPAAVSGVLPAGFVYDYYAFTLANDLAPDERLSLTVYDTGGDAAMHIMLLNDNGNSIHQNVSGANVHPQATGLTAGTYYIRVSGTFGTVDTPYVLAADLFTTQQDSP